MQARVAKIHEWADEWVDASVERRREIAKQLYDDCYREGGVPGAVELLALGLVDSDEEVGESAHWGLNYCAPNSIEPLIDHLTHVDEHVRERSAHALGNIGNKASSASDALRSRLHDPAPAVRKRAAWALGLIGDTSQQTIDTLAALGAGGELSDRRAALHALGNLGKEIEDPRVLQAHASIIVSSLDDNDDDVRWSALYAWEGLRWERTRSLHLLAQILAVDKSDRLQQAALSRIKELGVGQDLLPLVPLLATFVGAGSGLGATYACEILAALGPAASAAVPDLKAVAEGRDDGIAIRAAGALWSIERRVDDVLPTLTRLLPDYGEEVCDAICQIGPATASLLPQVIEAIAADDDWDLRWAATDALGALAENNPQVVSPLLDALNHPSPIVKGSAVRGLARVGSPAIPELSSLVKTDIDPRAEWAADALGRMGMVASPALSALRQAHARGPRPLAFWSAVAIARIAGDPAVVEYLFDALASSERPDMRCAAIEGLGALSRTTPGVALAIQRALEDDSDDVRAAATEAKLRFDMQPQ